MAEDHSRQPAPRRHAQFQGPPGAATAALHVSALWAIAVAQPLFDLLARSPEFFTAHRAEGADILLLTAGLTFLGPLIAGALLGVTALWNARLRRVTTLALVAVLLGLIAVQVLKRTVADQAAVAIPAAALAGLAGAVAYGRTRWAQLLASGLAIAVIAVPLLFLTRPPIRRLIAPRAASTSAISLRPTGELTSVVIVVLDEVPLASVLDDRGRIEERHYPNLARLARDGIFFRNATTVSDYTRWALPALVTGRYPRAELAPSSRDHPDTLFTLLAPTHHLEVSETVTGLCPDALCAQTGDDLDAHLGMMANDLAIVYLHVVLPGTLRAGLPALTDDWARFGAAGESRRKATTAARRRRAATRRRADDVILRVSDRTASARRFIRGITAADPQPALYFLHSMVSHTPHILLPSGQLNGTRSEALQLPRAVPGRPWEPWPDDGWLVAQSYQRHLLQLGFADRIVGELLAQLERVGLYDRVMIVVVSDHGATFRPGLPRRDYTERSAGDVMRVPLLIKFPPRVSTNAVKTLDVGGQRISDMNVQTIDVTPTVAQVAGVQVPWPTDGRSLLEARRPSEKVIYFDSARRVAKVGDQGPDADAALRWKRSLFDAADPYRVPRTDAFAELVGRPVRDLEVAGGGGEVHVDYLSDFENMDVSDESVAFDFAGRFRPAQARGAIYVAIAVNGVVQAVTRTWRVLPADWLATPPSSAWRVGRNTLDVFVVSQGPQGPVLRRSTIRPGRRDSPSGDEGTDQTPD